MSADRARSLAINKEDQSMEQQVLRIMEQEIDLGKARSSPRDRARQRSWNATGSIKTASGRWRTAGFAASTPAIRAVSSIQKHFPGNVLLEFEGRTVPPCSNDLNFTWRSAGWNEETDDAGVSYIAGLAGWWEGKTGIEHYPRYLCRAATPAGFP